MSWHLDKRGVGFVGCGAWGEVSHMKRLSSSLDGMIPVWHRGLFIKDTRILELSFIERA